MSQRLTTRQRDNAIEFDRVSRRFTISHERSESLQDWFINRLRRGRRGQRGQRTTESFWALQDVSFAIKRGETVGLIGRNGAGKSTMLKLVTGILEPSGGQVRVAGRTYAMLELGAGFHPELSGRDNIYLNGSIYGFGRRAIRRKFEEIVAFAELERFIDTPVKHYSSGMFMRLGFATAINMDPQILVIDEVLSVGDAAFQRRCNDAIRGLQEQGVTILLVSHSSEQIREFCTRAMLLSGGGVIADGEVEDVLTAYARLQMREGTSGEGNGHAAATLPGGDHAHAQFASAVLRDLHGTARQHFTPGAPLTVELAVLGDGQIPLDIILRWRTPLGLLLFEGRHALPPAMSGLPRSAICRFPALPIQSDDILVEALLCDPAQGVIIDTEEIHLHLDAPAGPLLQIEHNWTDTGASTATSTPNGKASPLIAGVRGK